MPSVTAQEAEPRNEGKNSFMGMAIKSDDLAPFPQICGIEESSSPIHFLSALNAYKNRTILSVTQEFLVNFTKTLNYRISQCEKCRANTSKINKLTQALACALEKEVKAVTEDPINVLLIDDQPMIAEAVRRMLLSETDITFHYCSDPTQAFKVARSCQPTVILQDLIMPEMEGLVLVRFLRAQNAPTRDVPLIVLSSKEEPVIKAKAFALGANDYIVKLPDKAELIARIRYHSKAYVNLLKRQEAEAILQADNLRMSKELDMLRQMQQMILPRTEELSAIEDLEIAGYMEPADEVGGDYYDVLYTDGLVTIAIGDVTGHGLESGIVMVMTQTAVRTLKEVRELDPVKFLDTLNRTIYKNVLRMNSEKNLTLVVLTYSEGKISISGQHEETIVVRTGGYIERIDTMNLGFPIGLDEEITDYINHTIIELNPGDGVVVYTDGIPEAYNLQKKQYGIEQLCDVISQNWHGSAEQVKQAVIDDVKQHIGEQKIFDDITLVVIKQKYFEKKEILTEQSIFEEAKETINEKKKFRSFRK